MPLADPVFPPLLTGHAVEAPLQPFTEACKRAGTGELGAGDIVWARSTARAELALVLEPQVSATHSLQMGPLMLVAAGDCLGALLPPQVPLHYRWPVTLLLNGGEAGSLQIAHAPVATRQTVPDWLVVGFGLQVDFDARDREPGEIPHLTALAEEGGGALDRTQILQSLAAHVLTWLDIWQEEGFRPVAQAFMARLEDATRERVEGEPLGLDEDASLLIKPAVGSTRALPLLEWRSS